MSLTREQSNRCVASLITVQRQVNNSTSYTQEYSTVLHSVTATAFS